MVILNIRQYIGTHFNAIFAKLVGLPPIRYRKQYLENMQGSRLQ